MAKKKAQPIKPMSSDEVFAHVDRLIKDSLDYNTSELSSQRSKSLKYYFGEPLGNEVAGQSQVVTRDVQETIDWIMPSMMKVFFNGSQVVKFNPSTAEDVPYAEQETEYVNYLFMRKNKGFEITYDWFQDALMMKNGIVKVYTEEENYPKFDYYDGITDEQVTEVLSNPDTDILARTDNGDGTFAIKVRTDCKKKNIKVCVIEPENFLIDRYATCFDDSLFVAHRELQTISYLRSKGVPEEILEELPYDEWDTSDSSPERLVRNLFDGSGDVAYHSNDNAEANRKCWVTESYVRLDVDGDGYSELRRIVTAGGHILWDDEWDSIPFADLTAHRMAHKFFGMSMYDKIKDLQELRTALMRAMVDNIYRQNNGRIAVVDGAVNMDDLVTNQKSGIVRVKAPNMIQDLPTPPMSAQSFEMLDRLERDRSKRTGVSERSQGLDENTLHSNQAMGSVNQLMTAAEQQIDLIARMFAETGYKRLMLLLHEHAVKFQDQEEVFELRGQYIRVNPASWRNRTDMTVMVGVGNMNKDQQLLHLTRMFELVQTVVGAGGMGILVTPKTIYNLLKEFTENAGYKDVTKFWQDPESPEGQAAMQAKAEADAKPKPDDIKAQAQLLTAQSGGQKNQADAQASNVEAQLKLAELELKKQEATVKLREMSLKEQQLEFEREQFAWERARDEAEFMLEAKQQRAAAIGDGKVPVSKKPRTKPSNS